MLGGLVRPGISFSPKELRAFASVRYQPDWLDRLLFRMMALGVLIAVCLAVFVLGVLIWTLI